MATLTLTLNKDNITAAVKADTYIAGLIDKATDPVKMAAYGYNEQAGDDAFHEVKLYRTLRAGVAKFSVAMSEYVDTSQTAASISNTLNKQSPFFNIQMTVGSRFNQAFKDVLATLAEEYIINSMLYSWWQTINIERSKQFLIFMDETMDSVKKCLAKSAPQVTESSYTNPTGVFANS